MNSYIALLMVYFKH